MIYEYGCRLDKDCIPAVTEQFWKAHTLYNNIIAAIQTVRGDAEKMLRKASADYNALCDLQEKLDSEFKEAKAKNDEEAMKRVRSMERDCWARSKPARKLAAASCKEALQEIFARIGRTKESDTYRLVVAAKAEGLFHNTADMTLDTALKAWDKVRKEGGRLNFRKAALRSTDHIDVRFTCAGGVPVEELLTGRHGLVSLGEPGQTADRPGARVYPGFRFRLRVGLNATGTWQHHRPFPAGARVTTIRLIRKRRGPDTKWAIQLQLSVPAIPTIEVGERKPLAAMHFGWSLTTEGTRRIASLCDEADPGLAEFIDLPESILADLDRSTKKRQERDVNRDEIMALIKDGRISTAGWLPEHVETLHELAKLPAQRVASKRIVALSRQVEQSGVECPVLKDWSTNDHWVWQEEAGIRARALNRRKNYYREFALNIVKRYETIVLSMPDLKEAALRVKGDGERNEMGQIARAARHAAALYEFKQALSWAARRADAVVLEAKDFSHVGTCAMCGSEIQRVDDLAVCECGTLDTKANSAAMLWQGWVGKYEAASQEIRRVFAEKKAESADRKKKKTEAMFMKRTLARVEGQQGVGDSLLWEDS